MKQRCIGSNSIRFVDFEKNDWKFELIDAGEFGSMMLTDRHCQLLSVVLLLA